MKIINDKDFICLVRFVRNRFGINLENKRQLINARLSFDIEKRGYSSFSEYISTILEFPDGEECQHMINRLSTNYTFFFRESDYIEKLSDVVLKDFSRSKANDCIRIWCAACSSGEEVYSIAMVLETYKKTHEPSLKYEIIGTDINTEMLEKARSGKYDNEGLSNIPEKFRQYVCHHTSSTFEISDSIRNKIKWQYRNLLDLSDVRSEYDIIFCRNVMIYFTPQLRNTLTKKLYDALLHGGYLFTGATESLDLERKYFKYLAPTFYQKI